MRDGGEDPGRLEDVITNLKGADGTGLVAISELYRQREHDHGGANGVRASRGRGGQRGSRLTGSSITHI
jgi:hypothetical protein